MIPTFVTAPRAAASGRIRIAAACCVGYRGFMAAAAWGQMAARRDIDLLLMLGDKPLWRHH